MNREQILISADLTPIAKLVLLFIIEKSKNGRKTLYLSRDAYSNSLHICQPSVTSALGQLEKLNLIRKVKNKLSFDRTLHYELVQE